jgi:hypothetical protein
MALSVFSAKNYSTKLKVTVQRTGKLGFTASTAESLHLSKDSFIKIARDDEDVENLYMIVSSSPDEDAFKISCISGYYSLSVAPLLKELGIDYLKKTVIFDLSRAASYDEEAGGIVYKMTKREKQRKKEAGM